MVKLSVNVNKIASLRNARGGNTPNLVDFVKLAEASGADGITIHPRPDERHITTQDTYDLKEVVATEYNIEGYPDERFMKLVRETRPEQATLVPDPPHVLTSNAGWDTVTHFDFLKACVAELKTYGTRVSIFMENNPEWIKKAKELGADRIELYTEAYAVDYKEDPTRAIQPYIASAELAQKLGLGINAGHDLSLENLAFFAQNIPGLAEVSIGHALVSDALLYGFENSVAMYKKELQLD